MPARSECHVADMNLSPDRLHGRAQLLEAARLQQVMDQGAMSQYRQRTSDDTNPLRIKLVAGNGNRPLADAIATHLDVT